MTDVEKLQSMNNGNDAGFYFESKGITLDTNNLNYLNSFANDQHGSMCLLYP